LLARAAVFRFGLFDEVGLDFRAAMDAVQLRKQPQILKIIEKSKKR
jgi:hypothetical protein